MDVSWTCRTQLPRFVDFLRVAMTVLPRRAKHCTRRAGGVAVLIEGINEARKQKIILSLQDLSKPAQSVLEMARVDKLFQVSGKNYLPPQQ